MKKLLKFVFIALVGILVFSVIGFFIWAETPVRPGPAALAALESDEFIYVFQREDHIVFYPAICEARIAEENATGEQHTIKALVFYPGGRVDYRAYAPALRKVAEQGVIVFLMRVRLNLAILDVEAGAPLLEKTEGIDVWAAGGHSLGGVAAALFAQNHPEIKGLVYWAFFPSDDSLKNSSLKVLSVHGTNDGFLSGAQLETAKASLPVNALFVPIEGGNHAQFGDYGLQNGDNLASIPPESQWEQVAQATVAFLETLVP